VVDAAGDQVAGEVDRGAELVSLEVFDQRSIRRLAPVVGSSKDTQQEVAGAQAKGGGADGRDAVLIALRVGEVE
jgi:hypothetical protein